MSIDRIDKFFGDDHSIKLVNRSVPEDFSFGSRPIRASRMSGLLLPGMKLPTPSGVPTTGDGLCVSWSPTGRTLMGGFSATSYFKGFTFDGENFTLMAPPTSFTALIDSIDWAPNARFLSVCSAASPYLNVYAFTEPNFFAAISIPNPSHIPPNRCLNASWSPDGRMLAVSHFDSPYISVYKLNLNISNIALSTLTKISNPGILPTGASSACSWSPDGKYLAVGHTVSPYLTVYKFNGTTLTKIPGPTTDAPSDQAEGLSWSPDGKILTVCAVAYPYVRSYLFENGAFRSGAFSFDGGFNPSRSIDCEWSPDGRFLAVGYVSSPYLHVYTFDGGAFTQNRTPDTALPGSVSGVSWSPDGRYLSASHVGSPRMSTYKGLPSRVVGGGVLELEPLSNLR